MPDGTVVEMPDQLDPALGARLRAFQQSGGKPPAPAPTGVGERALNLVKDVAATPFKIAGTAADVGSRLSAALDPSQAGSPLPAYGEHNYVPPALQHAPTVLSPEEQQFNETQKTPAQRAIEGAHGPLIDTLKENAGPAATLVGAVAGVPGAVRGGAAAMSGAVDRLEAIGAASPTEIAGAVRRATAPTPIQELNQAGYKYRPSDVQARNPTMQDVPGSTREAITSSPEQTQQIIRNNSALNTRLIGEDIGVPNATKLTPQHYAEARLAPGADYDRMGAGIGAVDKPLSDAPQRLQAALADNSPTALAPGAKLQVQRVLDGIGSGQYAGPQIIKDISYFRTVPNGRAIASALEDELGAQVQAKMPNEVGTYEKARTLFAKIQNAEDATTGGLIDAADYRRFAEANPRVLTGNSRLVALAGGELPAVTRLPTPTAAASPVNDPTLFGTLAHVGRSVAKKLPGANITRPGIQARIANAAPPPGPLPTGPYQRGIATPRQLELQGPSADLTPPPGEVGPQPLGAALAQPAPLPRPIQQQIKLRDERAQQPGGGTTPTPPIPEPYGGAQPPEGQLPKRLGDYLRYLMEHGPAPSTPTPGFTPSSDLRRLLDQGHTLDTIEQDPKTGKYRPILRSALRASEPNGE